MGNYIYDNILVFDDTNCTIAILNNKAGLINSLTGKPITEFIYDDLTEYYDDIWLFFHKDFIPLRLNNKWGVINIKGETVVDFIFDNEIEYIDGLIYTLKNKKYGILDRKFNTIIPFEYDELGYFESDYAKACKNNKWGVIDKQNNVIIDFIYDEITLYKNIVIVKKNEKYGICDLAGKVIQKPIYNECNYCEYQNSKLIPFYTKHKINYIDENGIIQKSFYFPKYTIVEELQNDLFLIRKNSKYGIVDKDNNVILEPKFKKIKQFGNKFIIDEKCLTSGKEKLFEFDKIYSHTNNYAIIIKNGKEGVIDSSGNIIIEPNYKFLNFPPESKYIAPYKDTGWGLIDIFGNIILDCKYQNIDICTNTSKEIAIVKNNNICYLLELKY